MKRNAVKTASALMASAMILSMTGCSNLPIGNNTEDIIDAGESFAKAAVACDLEKMGKVSVEDFEDDTKDWEGLLDFSDGDIYDYNAAEFNKEVAKTIEYEIDEDSAEIKKDKASVDVVFTIVDYKSVLEDDSFFDVDEMIDALEDADTDEIKASIELEKQDGEWLVTNYEDIMKDLYEFTDTTSIEFVEVFYDIPDETDPSAAATPTAAPTQAPVADSSSSSQTSDSDITFYGATYIGCVDVDYDNHIAYTYSDYSVGISQSYSSASGNADFTGYSIVVELDGNLFTTVEDDINIMLSGDDGRTQSGTYTITFYDPAGNAFWTGSVEVYDTDGVE